MFGSRISARAAAALKRAVQQSNQAATQLAQPLQKERLFLAKTTAEHSSGVTQSVDIYIGTKGAESASSQSVDAYNRGADLESGEWVYIKWIGDGWEILSRRSTTSTTGEGCGGCNEPAGNLIIDLGGGLICSDRYYFSPMCDALLPITFDYDTGSDWDGGPGTLSVSCTDDGTVTVTATLTISGTAVGDVTITISDGTNTWTWQNDTAFTPSLPVAMRRMTGPVDCPCSTWRPYPCLTPLDAA